MPMTGPIEYRLSAMFAVGSARGGCFLTAVNPGFLPGTGGGGVARVKSGTGPAVVCERCRPTTGGGCVAGLTAGLLGTGRPGLLTGLFGADKFTVNRF